MLKWKLIQDFQEKNKLLYNNHKINSFRILMDIWNTYIFLYDIILLINNKMVLYLSDFKNKFKEKKRNFKNLKFVIVNVCHAYYNLF